MKGFVFHPHHAQAEAIAGPLVESGIDVDVAWTADAATVRRVRRMRPDCVIVSLGSLRDGKTGLALARELWKTDDRPRTLLYLGGNEDDRENADVLGEWAGFGEVFEGICRIEQFIAAAAAATKGRTKSWPLVDGFYLLLYLHGGANLEYVLGEDTALLARHAAALDERALARILDAITHRCQGVRDAERRMSACEDDLHELFGFFRDGKARKRIVMKLNRLIIAERMPLFWLD